MKYNNNVITLLEKPKSRREILLY